MEPVIIVLALAMIILETSNNIYRLFFESRHYDFYQSYLAARSLISGANLYESGQGAYIYPSILRLHSDPLGQLPDKFAHLIWLGLNVSLIPQYSFSDFGYWLQDFSLVSTGGKRRALARWRCCYLWIRSMGNLFRIKMIY